MTWDSSLLHQSLESRDKLSENMVIRLLKVLQLTTNRFSVGHIGLLDQNYGEEFTKDINTQSQRVLEDNC